MMSTISPNVDFVGHFAGMLAGFLLAIILADMQEEHQPPWYNKAKLTATWRFNTAKKSAWLAFGTKWETHVATYLDSPKYKGLQTSDC